MECFEGHSPSPTTPQMIYTCSGGYMLLEPLMEGTNVMYPYLEFHKYRVLVMQLTGIHMILVTHRFYVFPCESDLGRFGEEKPPLFSCVVDVAH
jgi:hypothetical protein